MLGHAFSGGRTLADVALDRVRDGTPAGSSDVNYRRFCRDQAHDGLGGLLAEFPVLARVIATVTLNWADTCRETLNRLEADRADLERMFGIPPDDSVIAVATGLSDPHRAGRGVAILTFESGGRAVYKPRSVMIEDTYQRFVALVSRQLDADPLQQLAVLDRGTHGYVEYVPHHAAVDSEELGRFYTNAGRLLAILFLLGATDCHWENLIASRDQLVLVDAETLLEGRPKPSSEWPRTESSASDSIEDSVLRTGMLPSWISVGPARSIDISALGARAPEDAPSLRPGWCFTNTDDMVWGDRSVPQPVPTCLPVPAGIPNPLAAHSDNVVDGFGQVLALVQRSELREDLRAAMRAFAGAPRRIVVRATRTYVLIQEDALSPDALRAADSRALGLERLARAYVLDEAKPQTWPLLHHEIAALEDLDVPYFEGSVGCADLCVRDDVVVPGYYEREGLSESLARLERISDGESHWQARLIHGAVAAHLFEMAPSVSRPSGTSRSQPSGAHDAYDIARLIERGALDDPTGPPTWLTVGLMSDATRVQLGLVPPGLYDGRSGIAAFLYDCGEVALATRVLQPVLDALDDGDPARFDRYVRDIGLGMSGLGGILRVLCYCAGDERSLSPWRVLAKRVVGALGDHLLAGEHMCDLLSGVAGLAVPVAALHGLEPTDDSARVLDGIGQALVERQNEAGGWPFAIGHPPLAGLSHGASGIATALAHIAVSLDQEVFADAAARGLRYEAELFDAEARNWPDLRRSLEPVDRLGMRSWCHGSVGVALARLRMLELLGAHPDAPRWRDELAVAIDSSIAAPQTPVDHLCCGNLGRAVVIALAGQATGNATWEAKAARLSACVTGAAGASPENYRLLLGIDGTSGLQLPGLMTGLSGIGMHLLHGSDLQWARQLLI